MSGAHFVNGKKEPPVSESSTSFAICQAGEVPTGGGYIVSGTDRNKVTVDLSEQYATAWAVVAENIAGHAGSSWKLIANAVCATTPGS